MNTISKPPRELAIVPSIEETITQWIKVIQKSFPDISIARSTDEDFSKTLEMFDERITYYLFDAEVWTDILEKDIAFITFISHGETILKESVFFFYYDNTAIELINAIDFEYKDTREFVEGYGHIDDEEGDPPHHYVHPDGYIPWEQALKELGERMRKNQISSPPTKD
jgi:hypothetical protein